MKPATREYMLKRWAERRTHEATYIEYCQKCQANTPHRYLSRQGLTWHYQCKICGAHTTIEGDWTKHRQ